MNNTRRNHRHEVDLQSGKRDYFLVIELAEQTPAMTHLLPSFLRFYFPEQWNSRKISRGKMSDEPMLQWKCPHTHTHTCTHMHAHAHTALWFPAWLSVSLFLVVHYSCSERPWELFCKWGEMVGRDGNPERWAVGHRLQKLLGNFIFFIFYSLRCTVSIGHPALSNSQSSVVRAKRRRHAAGFLPREEGDGEYLNEPCLFTTFIDSN